MEMLRQIHDSQSTEASSRRIFREDNSATFFIIKSQIYCQQIFAITSRSRERRQASALHHHPRTNAHSFNSERECHKVG